MKPGNTVFETCLYLIYIKDWNLGFKAPTLGARHRESVGVAYYNIIVCVLYIA